MENKKYQYVDFSDGKTTLGGAFRYAMQGERWTTFCYLNHDALSVTTESYRSKATAKSAVRCVVDDAYGKANRIFKPGGKDCLASEAAKKYGRYLSQRVTPLLDRLDAVCVHDPQKKEVLSKLREKIARAESHLCEQFEEDLRENADYYKMYEKSYFIDKVEIEELDSGVDLFDSNLANGVARLFFRDVEYMATGLLEVMSELQDDMNSHAQMFFSSAHDEYRRFCREIECIADELGRGVSDETLVQIGILKEVACC